MRPAPIASGTAPREAARPAAVATPTTEAAKPAVVTPVAAETRKPVVAAAETPRPAAAVAVPTAPPKRVAAATTPEPARPRTATPADEARSSARVDVERSVPPAANPVAPSSRRFGTLPIPPPAPRRTLGQADVDVDNPAAVETPVKMKLEVLVYSDVAAERMVFINGRKYKQGDTVAERARIEEIRPDSVVLSEEGRRFTLRQ
jgi:general secretion pathway protein B